MGIEDMSFMNMSIIMNIAACVRRRQLRQKDSNEPIATSVMVCAAVSSDAMVNGHVRMVNRWFHAVWHRQNTKKPSEKISANFNWADQVCTMSEDGRFRKMRKRLTKHHTVKHDKPVQI